MRHTILYPADFFNIKAVDPDYEYELDTLKEKYTKMVHFAHQEISH